MLSLSLQISAAQHFTVSEHTASDGLPNNLVKHVLQDETGFVWLSTDGGLVRFDGVNLTVYRSSDGLPDNYVKSTFEDSRGRLFVITDLGVAEVARSTAVEFRHILSGSTSPGDSLLFYPKSMFEDRYRNLWVADARGLVRISDQDMRRYPMPAYSWPSSFVRSYSLAEDTRGHLIAASERGHIFVFDEQRDRFIESATGTDIDQLNVLTTRPDGSLLAAGGTGLFSFRISAERQVVDWKTVLVQSQIMDLQHTPDGDLLLATAGYGLLSVSRDGVGVTVEPLERLSSRIVHHVTVDDEGTIFAATDNGLAVIRPSHFSPALRLKSTAIQAVAADPAGRVFGIEETSLFRMDRHGTRVIREDIFSAPEVLTALAIDDSTYWAGSASGIVYRYTDGHLTTIRLNSDHAVTSLAIDGSGAAWLAQHGESGIARVGRDTAVRYYGSVDGLVSPINVVRYRRGRMLAGGTGSAYLYRYDDAADRFMDLSQRFHPEEELNLTVNDVHLAGDGALWLGTESGLFALREDQPLRPLRDAAIDRHGVLALAGDRFGQIWIGTTGGVYRYSGDDLSAFNRDPGISNLTVHHRSLVLDSEHRLWVGHHDGVSFWSRQPGEALLSPRPTPVRLAVDGVRVDAGGEMLSIPFGSHLEVDFVSLSYPGSSVRYSTRLGGEKAWSTPIRDGHVHIAQVRPGTRQLEIRAQQAGQLWSPPAVLKIAVDIPWYREWWAISLFIACSLAVLAGMWWVHGQIRTIQLRAQNERLEQLVTRRTKELSEQKRTIEQTNLELKAVLERNHEFLGIAAHDLRNPLTSLIGFSELLLDASREMGPDEFLSKSGDILPVFHRAASTMQGVLQDLLDSQLIERDDADMRMEDTDFTQLVRSVVNMNTVASRRKGITLSFNPGGVFRAPVDVRSMHRVIDNLVSNAVKYSPPGTEVVVSLEHTIGALRFSVKDEGPGLTKEDLGRVFGKLQRLSARPTGGESSTGLGLYIARGITEMHAGRIGVDSVAGEGAEFWIELPIRDMRAAA